MNQENREINSISNALVIFLRSYHENDIKLLKQKTGKNVLEIDYNELIGFLSEYKDQFNPAFEKTIEILDKKLQKVCKRENVYNVIKNMPYNVFIRDIDASHANKFISKLYIYLI